MQTGDRAVGPGVIPDRILRENNFAVKDRRKVRPDALILEEKLGGKKRKHDGRDQPAHLPKGGRGKAFILEVGYTNETRYEEKLQEKNSNIAPLSSCWRHQALKQYSVQSSWVQPEAYSTPVKMPC